MDEVQVHQEVGALEQLLAGLEKLADDESRRTATGAVEGLLRLYGEGLRRIVEQVAASPAVAEALIADELVGHLLLLHGLHPATLEERVAGALDEVRPYLGSHGGGVKLVDVDRGVARVRLEGTCSGCAASTMTLKLAVEEAVLRAAPELSAVEAVDDDAAAPSGPTLPLVDSAGAALPLIDSALPAIPAPGGWQGAGASSQLTGNGKPVRREVNGTPMLFIGLGEHLYAYIDRCPACGAAVTRPTISAGALVCAGCERRYDIRAAGQCLDGALLGLDPVPLLVDDDGGVRVAVQGAGP